MNSTIASQAFSSATSVIALHCSGSGAAQWRKLGEALGSRHAFVVPEHYGCDSTGPWSGERAFTLADEAARTIGIIDARDPRFVSTVEAYERLLVDRGVMLRYRNKEE